MANRILTVVACVVLIGLAIFVVAMNLRGTPDSPRPVSQPQQQVVARRPVQASPQSIDDVAREVRTTEVSAESAEPDKSPKLATPRKFTWAELEAEFDRLRQDRKERPQAMHELSDWYERVSSPSFTESKNFLDHFERLKSWRDVNPDSSTRLVALAKTYIAYAWAARGGGWAYTVTPEGWEQFHGRLTEARRLLEQAIEMGVQDGEAYALLIEVAKAEALPDEQARQWLNEGQKLDPGYAWMYARMAEYLLPRWHGQPGDVERFAAEMTRELPGDDGLDAFAHIAWQVNRYDRTTLWWGQYDRPLLGKSARVLAQRYPSAPLMVNFAAQCAYAAQDQSAAREIAPLIGDFDEKTSIWPWENMHKDFMQWSTAPPAPNGEDRWLWLATTGCRGFALAPGAKAVWSAQQYGGDIHSIDIESGRIRETLPGPGGVLNEIEFDNARRWIVASYRAGPFVGWILWDLKNQDSQPHPTTEQVRALAIHPAMPQIAWAESKTVRTVDSETGKELLNFSMPDYVHRLEFSGDGSLLYVMTGTKSVCSAATGKVLYELPSGRPDSAIKLQCDDFLCFDEQGRVYASAFDTSSPARQKCLARGAADGSTWEILIPLIGAGPARLSADRTRLAVADPVDRRSGPTSIEVWDVASARLIERLGGHWNLIQSMSFSDDGTTLTSQGNDVLKAWTVPRGK